MHQAVRVLLVDDDSDDQFLIRRLLERVDGARFAVDGVATYTAALAEVGRRRHDVYLLDYHLGDQTGLDLLRAALAAGSPGPFVLLTGSGDRGVDMAALAAGATDYLSKDELDAPALERVIRYALERTRVTARVVQAEKAEALGRLAAGVAHYLNNMLTGVIGYAELALAQLPAGDPVRAMVEAMRSSGDRAADLVRQLLLFGGRQPVAPVPFGLSALVRSVEPLLSCLVPRGGRLELAPHPADPWVLADPGQIRQALVDVVAFAADRLPSGGTITVRTAIATDGRGTLAVSDTGPGLDAAALARLFEPFGLPGDGGTEPVGLRLAGVLGIARRAGGEVEVDTAPGRGTTISVHLPAAGRPTTGV